MASGSGMPIFPHKCTHNPTNYIKKTEDEHTAERLRMREDGIKARTYFNKQIDENKTAHHVEI